MKKILLFLTLLTALLIPGLAISHTTQAVDVFQYCSGEGSKLAPNAAKTDACAEVLAQREREKKGESANPFVRTIKVVLNILSILLGVISVIVIIVAGLRMILANGDAAGIAKARNGIIYALIGLIVAILAQAIVQLVLSKL